MQKRPESAVKQTTVMQAIGQSQTLSGMLDLHSQSQLYLKTVENLLPVGMRDQLLAGPVDQGVWCILVRHNAAAAKLRQLLPTLGAHLRSKGHAVEQIRIKLMSK
jgi:hypothetical protein